MTETLAALLVIATAAILAPFIADAIPRLRVPAVVIEIALGIMIGPQLLDLAQVDASIDTLSRFGLGFLFFLAGFELDFSRLKGRPLLLGLTGWVLSVALGLVLAAVLQATGLAGAVLFVGLAMATTTIGTLMPILRDAGELETRFGTFVLGAGAVAEFGPILAMALLLNSERGDLISAGMFALFVLVVVVTFLLAEWWRPRRAVQLVRKTLRSSAQVAVRLSIVLLAGMAALAEVLGLDFLVGAFAAGIIAAQVVRIAQKDHPEEVEVVRIKYEGIGFGFFIPVFFIVSGIKFDLHTLLSSPISLLMVPVFLILFLFVRGLPAMLLYRRDLDRAERVPLRCCPQPGCR